MSVSFDAVVPERIYVCWLLIMTPGNRGRSPFNKASVLRLNVLFALAPQPDPWKFGRTEPEHELGVPPKNPKLGQHTSSPQIIRLLDEGFCLAFGMASCINAHKKHVDVYLDSARPN